MLERIPGWILRPVIKLAARWPWLARKLNRMVIDGAARAARNRPHPWSTVHPYVSWRSLTEMTWSARHLPPAPQDGLPRPEDLVPLFQARGAHRPCPKSTCLFPAFAQYLTDGFIRTRMPQSFEPEALRKQNTSNHQIDLSPLYGRTQDQTLALRLLDETQGRRGLLKSQMIGEEEFPPYLCDKDGAIKAEFAGLDRPLGIDKLTGGNEILKQALFACGGDRVNSAPSVVVMNTLFLREHNRVAREIGAQNPDWDDERVFETARNVVIVCFIKIVVEEYISHIAPAPFRLIADATVAWTAPWNRPNWITTEFSLLYRWHSLVPAEMTWAGRSYPVGQTFMNNFPVIDAGLGGALAELSGQAANALGPMNTAEPLIKFEVSAIRQGRLVELAPFADYCRYMSMKPPARFEDISSDPVVAAELRRLYGDPGKVDFYVGLFMEDNLKNGALPALLQAMVAVDAFSQALTNPLLSEHVWKEETFSPHGWQVIRETSSIRDIAARNGALPSEDAFIGMTRRDWGYAW